MMDRYTANVVLPGVHPEEVQERFEYRLRRDGFAPTYVPEAHGYVVTGEDETLEGFAGRLEALLPPGATVDDYGERGNL